MKLLGRFFSLLALAVFLFLSTGFEASAHEEKSCHEQTQADEDRSSPSGHDSTCPCKGACQLGHCHAAYSGLFGRQSHFLSYPALLSLGIYGPSQAVYLNPYLGKIIQPPRA